MKCPCSDREHDVPTALWHRAYCHWYDHRDQGHGFRAAFWGWAADRLVWVVDLAANRRAERMGRSRG